MSEVKLLYDRKVESFYPWILLFLTIILTFLGNASLHITDPVESNYAETALEMLRQGEFFSPRIFDHYWYDKPIFFYWELLLSFRIFGVTDFAARLGSSLFGIIGIELTYFFLKKLYTSGRAFTASLILLTSVEYFYLSKAVITDMTLFVFLEATLMSFYLGYIEKNHRWYYVAYAFAALGTLTKGPIGLGLPGLVILFFLFWRRDLGEVFHLKLLSGGLLYGILAGLWYGPMVFLHGNDFLLNFFGVHNFLRATVSEHPNQNVWWYYILIFFLGCAPWSFTLPLAGTIKSVFYRVQHILEEIIHSKMLPEADVRTAFFTSWGIVTIVIFELIQTKYCTYTFPYMVPIAVGFSSYLVHHKKAVIGVASATFLLYSVLIYTVAIPQCRKESSYEVAQVVKILADKDTFLVTYGGRYPVSLTYYSGHTARRLKRSAQIPYLLPKGMDWNAKNMMPFASIESLAERREVMAVVEKRKWERFKEEMKGTWQCLYENEKWVLLSRK